MPACLDCNEETPNAFRVCDSCVETRVRESREAQGLPPKVTDPATNQRVAVLMRKGAA